MRRNKYEDHAICTNPDNGRVVCVDLVDTTYQIRDNYGQISDDSVSVAHMLQAVRIQQQLYPHSSYAMALGFHWLLTK